MIHKNGYWITQDKEYRFDVRLMKRLIRFVRNKHINSVVDIGCGDGSYTKGFIDKGISCFGYDGNPYTAKITNGLCSTMDFSRKTHIGECEMVLCLEVAEHIPQKYEQIFIDNLARASSRFIILSWAVEGQGGIGHVNCRNNSYVISKMIDKGFVYNKKASMKIRRNVKLSWFKNTLMIYERFSSSTHIM